MRRSQRTRYYGNVQWWHLVIWCDVVHLSPHYHAAIHSFNIHTISPRMWRAMTNKKLNAFNVILPVFAFTTRVLALVRCRFIHPDCNAQCVCVCKWSRSLLFKSVLCLQNEHIRRVRALVPTTEMQQVYTCPFLFFFYMSNFFFCLLVSLRCYCYWFAFFLFSLSIIIIPIAFVEYSTRFTEATAEQQPFSNGALHELRMYTLKVSKFTNHQSWPHVFIVISLT